MPGFTTYSQRKILNHTLGKEAWPMPTVYVALCSTAPTDTAAGTEATYTGYARKATAAADWNSATDAVPSVSTNANNLTFAQCTAGNQSLTHGELWDAATGGNRIGWGALPQALAVAPGISPNIPAGQLIVSLD